MNRLPFLFITTGIFGFVLFHFVSLLSLTNWISEYLRAPSGWFHVHLFVLGWASMLAMGAVYQLINVILQSKIYSEKLGFIHYFVFTIGLFGLLLGFISGQVLWIGLFATIAFIGILLFTWNIFATLRHAAQWNAITISAACAVLYLALAGISGLLMGLNIAFGGWNDLHQHLFGAHIWLGSVGWFGLLITGFSYKMLPMFYLSHNYPEKLQSIILILWNAAVILGVAYFLLSPTIWVFIGALLLLTVAMIMYNIHLIQIKKHRHKKTPGAGIKWSVYASQALAVIAIGLLISSLWLPNQMLSAKPILFAGWIYLGGWVSFTILSYASKIVPFLWWTHKYGGQVGKPGTPVMANMLSETKVHVGLTLIAITTVLVWIGLLFGVNWLTAISGVAYSLSSLVYIAFIAYVFAK